MYFRQNTNNMFKYVQLNQHDRKFENHDRNFRNVERWCEKNTLNNEKKPLQHKYSNTEL